MPIFKFSVSDAQLAGFKAAARDNLLDVNDWARGHLATLAAQQMTKAPQEKPVKLSAAERKRLERFEDKLRSIANDLDCKGHVGQFLVMKMADLHLSAELKAFYAEFMDWCLANGHVDEAALEEGQKLHEQRQAWHAEQREKMRSVKATRVFLPEK